MNNSNKLTNFPSPLVLSDWPKRPILSKDIFKFLKDYLNIFFDFLRKLSESPHINASFFARDHFFIFISAKNASSREENASRYTKMIGSLCNV